jgi:hypothetical protein
MYIYQNYEQMVEALRLHANRQADKITAKLKTIGPRTHEAINLQGQRAAYTELWYMMKDFELRDAPTQEPDNATPPDTTTT